jgi:HAD superfamily hydrolase (TIGR01662 family)
MTPVLGGGPVAAVLFDYGNTLATFQRPDAALMAAYRTIETDLRARGFRPPAAAVLESRVHDRVEAIAEAHQREGHLEEINLVAAAREAYADLDLTLDPSTLHHVLHLEQVAWWAGVEVDPQTIPTLDLLRSRGLRVGLCSNAPYRVESLHAQLDHFGLAGHLDAVVFSAQVGWRKPAPQIFERAMAELGATPETSVMVGDSPSDDIAGAQALGLRAVLLQRGAPKGGEAGRAADAVIHALAQVPPLVIGYEVL